MMEFFRKHKFVIYTITIVGFLGGILIGFGGYLFGPFKTYDSVAIVNGAKIPYSKFKNYLNRALDYHRDNELEVTPELIQREKTETLQQLIQQEIFTQQAKKHGIIVSNKELASRIQSIPIFQDNGTFSQRLYFQTVIHRFKSTIEEFEEEQRREIAGFKLRRFLSLNMGISESQIEDAYKIKYATDLKAMLDEIKRMEISEDEFKEAYKIENDGTLDGFAKNRNSFANKYKERKHKEQFAEQYRNRLFSQYMNDWFQKTVAEAKIRVFLNEIEKAERRFEGTEEAPL